MRIVNGKWMILVIAIDHRLAMLRTRYTAGPSKTLQKGIFWKKRDRGESVMDSEWKKSVQPNVHPNICFKNGRNQLRIVGFSRIVDISLEVPQKIDAALNLA